VGELLASLALWQSPPPVYGVCVSLVLSPCPCSANSWRSHDAAERLSPGGSARAMCCWLRDAWGLLAPNDLLSVLAALPPSTQSCMRS